MVECLATIYCLLWDYISSSAYTVYNDYDTKKQVFSESGVGSNLTVQQHCSHIHHILFIYFQSMAYETEYCICEFGVLLMRCRVMAYIDIYTSFSAFS